MVPQHPGGRRLSSASPGESSAGLPDTGLLATAVDRLRHLGLLPEGETRWVDLGGRDLTRSTVRALAVSVGSGDPVRVFHKTIKPREGSKKTEIMVAELTESLAVAEEMEDTLVAHLPAGVEIARTLAVDIENLEAITLGVPGVALGALWRRSLTPSARRRAHAAIRLVGETCRIMEEHCRYEGELHDRLTGEDVVDRRLGRVAGVFDERDLNVIGEALAGLEQEAVAMNVPIVRVHGDLNSSNVLIHDGRVGVIDFSWQARLRLSDLSHFAFRLEYESGSPADFARDLVGALLDGYGDPHVTSTPAWRFLRFSKLIRVVATGSGSRNPLARWRAGRARRELVEELGL